MTIDDDGPFVDHATLSRPHRWTLADFLSTHRYWALFAASLLVVLAGNAMSTVMPLMLMGAAGTLESVGILHLGTSAGWVVGAFVAFVVAPRRGRPALIGPSLIAIATTVAFLSMPGVWSSSVFLIAFGLGCGTVQGVFPLALAVFLADGRASRIDFAGALFILSAPVVAGILAPMGVSLLYGSAGGWVVGAGLLGCLALAVAMLLPVRRLRFDDAPHPRHRPLPPRRRSAVAVAAILLAPPVLSALFALAFYLAPPPDVEAAVLTPVVLALAFLMLCIAVAVFCYLVFWLYRIHGELAGAAPSQRLLTPLAAVPVALFVPFGLPVLLVTLGDLLNDRARNEGTGRAISVAWLAVWSVLLPPIAIAMVQSAANSSYDAPGDTR